MFVRFERSKIDVNECSIHLVRRGFGPFDPTDTPILDPTARYQPVRALVGVFLFVFDAEILYAVLVRAVVHGKAARFDVGFHFDLKKEDVAPSVVVVTANTLWRLTTKQRVPRGLSRRCFHAVWPPRAPYPYSRRGQTPRGSSRGFLGGGLSYSNTFRENSCFPSRRPRRCRRTSPTGSQCWRFCRCSCARTRRSSC